MAQISCRYFNGYKPCGLSDQCDDGCPSFSTQKERILVVHLYALGAVLRATSLLPALRRRYPRCHITWVTSSAASSLLENNPYIDSVMSLNLETLLKLSGRKFDAAYCIDKSAEAFGIIRQVRVKQFYGFKSDENTGAILPANPQANELWELGLSNHKKFFLNKKPETQLMVEALDLGRFHRDEYVLQLSPTEQELVEMRRQQWNPKGLPVLGINTGCSGVIPYKKLSVPYQRRLITEILKRHNLRVVLLGGSEDTLRNQQIAAGLPVVLSPTQQGLRDGLCSVAACDLVLSGDSLGMHMAIGLKKWTVAWFGPTCEQEIDLYERGVKVKTQSGCSPCWKRVCHQPVMCYDEVDQKELLQGIEKGIQWLSTLSSKQPSSETSTSLSL